MLAGIFKFLFQQIQDIYNIYPEVACGLDHSSDISQGETVWPWGSAKQFYPGPSSDYLNLNELSKLHSLSVKRWDYLPPLVQGLEVRMLWWKLNKQWL